MATEIERKFLVTGDNWRNQAHGVLIKQGYLCADVQRAVRVRRTGTHAWLTIKGGGEGISRLEYEYPVPLQDADDLLALCLPGVISKTRYTLDVAGHRWEIDEFHEANAGLVLAEIELDRIDEPFERPEWVGAEVSDDARYYNASLISNPYSAWRSD